MRAIVRRSWVIGSGLLFSCLFAGCLATTQVPPTTGTEDRLLTFAALMGGPFGAPVLLEGMGMGDAPLAPWQLLGILAAPLIAAHPVKPSAGTACVSALGFALWLWAGFISVIYCYYAG